MMKMRARKPILKTKMMRDNDYSKLLLEDLLDDIESSDALKKTAA